MPEHRILNTICRIKLLLLALFVSFSGCTEIVLETLPSTPILSFDELKQTVSQIRKLPFQHEVLLESRRIQDIKANLEKSALEEYGIEKFQQVAQVYARLGLLSETSDFPNTLAKFRLLQQGTHYNSQRKRIVVPKEPWSPGLSFLGPAQGQEDAKNDTGKQLLLTLALNNALQDQHFRWKEQLKRINTKDARLAFRALVNGDANLVGLAHLMGDGEEHPLKVLDKIKGLAILASRMEKGFLNFPELLRQKTLFNVIHGSQFVIWAYSFKGWEGVNRLYSDPPISTEQILHPEKYYEKREGITTIATWSLARQFENDGMKVFDETLGEFLIRVLLRRNLPEDEADQAAAGWAGDHLLAFQKGQKLVLGWITAWDSREDAVQFYRSYRQALESQYDLSLKPTPGGGDSLTTPLQSATPLLLQLKKNLVFFLDGIPWPRSREIAEEVWKEMETGPEPQTIPFDLVQRLVSHSPPAKK
ncbi:MAG: hypothetical protein O7C72_05100 [Deltaproteobacteria bacterium]|nr:hypothetical protein [Deltaproteobacteria bacterium]